MRKEIPLDEFTVSVHPEGIYQKCRNCGKETRVDMKKGVAKLIYCPECGFSIDCKPENENAEPNSFKELREASGMNKTQFAKYFGIPFRTVQDWELGNRKCNDYLLGLMEYKLKHEGLIHADQK